MQKAKFKEYINVRTGYRKKLKEANFTDGYNKNFKRIRCKSKIAEGDFLRNVEVKDKKTETFKENSLSFLCGLNKGSNREKLVELEYEPRHNECKQGHRLKDEAHMALNGKIWETMIANSKKKLVAERGITLLVLILTVVIMIILAAVTINLTLGEGGLIDQAKWAAEQTANSTKSEQEQLDNVASQINDIIAGIGSGGSENITAKVTHVDNETGVDTKNSKWVLTESADPIGTSDGEVSKYTGKFTTNGETITLDSSASGIYYLHVFTTDVAGNKTETVSNAITISAITGTVTQNRHVTWDAGKATLVLQSSETGGSKLKIVYKINEQESWQDYNGTSITGLSHGDKVTACLTNEGQTTYGPELNITIEDKKAPVVTVTAQQIKPVKQMEKEGKTTKVNYMTSLNQGLLKRVAMDKEQQVGESQTL